MAIKVLFIEPGDKLDFEAMLDADVIAEFDTGDFLYISKDKLHGHKGSVHNRIFIEFLQGGFE